MSFPFRLQELSAPQRISTVAAFLVPAFALVLQSGYSYGAALLAIGALVTLFKWPREPHDRATWMLVAAMLVMGVLWIAMADPQENSGRWDRPAKFVLATVCLMYVTTFPPRASALFWGLVVGCLGAGAVALWQVHVEGVDRASGFPSKHTNAIQWGNLALLMAVMLALQASCLWQRLRTSGKVLAVLGVLAAVHGSILSQSRGGWLALLVAIPVGVVLIYQINRRALGKAGLLLIAMLVLAGALNFKVVAARMHLMEKEVQVYDNTHDANTSVGQRFEHWRFAWDISRERPLLGWGMGGYMAEKERRVAAGLYEPVIVEFKYAHNEMLDVLAKTGLVGLAALMWFYALPIWIFWPTRARLAIYADRPELRSQVLALRLSGLSIPVLYIGFGLTQVFFAHNSGIMFYLFMITVTWSALLGLEHVSARAGRPTVTETTPERERQVLA